MLRRLLYTAIDCIGYYIIERLFFNNNKIVKKEYKHYNRMNKKCYKK